MNKVTLIGHLGKDPELKEFDNGGKIANITVATDESYKDKDGNKVQQTEWHNVVFNGKLADVINKFFKKGSKIALIGKLRTRSWEDKDGNKRYQTEILASEFEFIESAKAGSNSATQSGAASASTNVEDDEQDLPF